MEFKELPVEEEARRFKDHLELENNERVILSGIFGLGKTYFIDKFFELYSEEFLQFRLKPVNYSVSQNEDIFQLIKFDIAFQLLAQEDLQFDEIKFDTKTYSEYFLMENYKSIIKNLIYSLSKIDQRIDAIVKPSLELAERIAKEKEGLEIDDKATLLRFLSAFPTTAGTIREEDDITILINHLVQGLKAGDKKKKIILTIDDLDRIDPEHIFRILNVFSAHFDYLEGQNKFDFDQVILICDIENIRAIFHHRYGINIDFAGYIDKFYSHEIYYYQFKEVIIKHIANFLQVIKLDDKKIQGQLGSRQPDEFLRDELSFVLVHMVLANSISMRLLANFLKKERKIKEYRLLFDSYRVNSKTTPVLVLLELLKDILGGKINLSSALQRCVARFPEVSFTAFNPWWNMRFGNLLMLIDQKKTGLKPTQDIIRFRDDTLDIQASYKIDTYSNHGLIGRIVEIGSLEDEMAWDSNISNPVQQLKKKNLPYFQLLKESLEVLEGITKD